MNKQYLKIRVKIDGSDKIAEYGFDNHKAYLHKFTELRKSYDILSEHTSTAIVVRPKPDLFS